MSPDQGDDATAIKKTEDEPTGMTEDEIREMQMRALAVTFKNFADKH